MDSPDNPFRVYDAKGVSDAPLKPKAGSAYEDMMATTTVRGSVAQNFDRLPIAFAIALGLVGLLLARLFFLQVVQGADYLGLSEGNRIRLHPIEAPRGVVFARTGEKLISNIPDFEIRVIPSDFPKQPEEVAVIISDIATVLDVHPSELEGAFADFPPFAFEPLTIIEGVNHEQAVRIMMKTHTTPGIMVKATASRAYEHPELYSHILGYTGKISEEEYEALRGTGYYLADKVGKTGVEFSYEQVLRGTFGLEEVEVNSLGIEQQVVATNDPIPGKNLILGIDHNLQQTAVDSLKNAMEETGAPGGVIIAIDPRNGAIRAMVSLPAYDNNKFVGGISQDDYTAYVEDEGKPLYHRAISGTYPSGSTIKMMIAAAALAEGVVNSSTSFLSTGGIEINNQWYFPDWKGGGHGMTDVRKAIAESVNTYFYIVGGGYEDVTGLGIDRIRYYGDLFGFGKTLGIDLPHEAEGFLPSPEWKERVKGESWYIGDTYHAAIGQGDVLVTPIQIAAYTAAIANGGRLWKPFVAEFTEDADGSSRSELAGVSLNEQVIEPGYIEIIREGMRQTVTIGSARQLQTVPVPVSAKTGTAQFSGEGTHAWITTFAPYEEPELVVTVLVENGGGGSAVAQPIARDILNAYFSENTDNNEDETSE